MKTKRTFFYCLVAVTLALIFIACPEPEAELPYSAGLEFKLINNGTAYSVSAGTAKSGAVIIPASYKDLPVTEIGSIAFYECTELTKITIPASVVSIGESAFYGCTGLTSMNIPASVTTIGGIAFSNCTSLKSIDLAVGGMLTTIGNSAFYGCTDLTDITIPNNVTTIGGMAFSNCTGLIYITIPVNVTSIGSRTFDGCSRLISVTFTAGSVSIDDYTFPEGNNGYGGNYLKIAYLIDSAGTYLRDSGGSIWMKQTEGLSFELITYGSNANTYRVRKGTVTGGMIVISAIHNGLPVSEIGSEYDDYQSAFSNTDITSIIIPASVTSIGRWAFYGCTSLETVTFASGSQLQTIGEKAFSSCTNLETVTFTSGSKLQTISYEAFFSCTSLTGITIPTSVTSIGDYAFLGCVGLTGITFASDSQLQIIGIQAFSYCTSLTAITIPASVTSIGNYAFAGYYDNPMALTTVTFAPGSAITSENFGDNAFPASGGFGDDLKTAYLASGAGTYTRANGGSDWTKQ